MNADVIRLKQGNKMNRRNSILLGILVPAVVALCSCSQPDQGSDKAVEQSSTKTTTNGEQMDSEIELEGHKIRVMSGPYISDGSPTPEANEFAAKLVAMLPEMKNVAASGLLDTYNESWVDDDHHELTAPEFVSNLSSPELVIYDAIGAATIYFTDSDMFGGHKVAVSVWKGEIDDASIK